MAEDLIDSDVSPVGRTGLSAESILRCLLLKQQLRVSYEQLAFHLSDSMTYRAFARLGHLMPSRSGLQSTSRDRAGIKIRFVDQRKPAKSLAFRIFNAKKAEKEVLYPDLLRITRLVIKQAERGLSRVAETVCLTPSQQTWCRDLAHYRALALQVVTQTERRVLQGERVPASQKLVSLFEPHTDIIVKGFRDVQYGHKVNLSSDKNGFITAFSIEDGNPSDKDLFLPVLDYHDSALGQLPRAVVADGGYASQANVSAGRARGVKQVVFHKPVWVSLSAMGVKSKTFQALKHFRAGVEGNISELKRAFGATKARWKGHDGFKVFVWASVLSNNLVRLARLDTG